MEPIGVDRKALPNNLIMIGMFGSGKSTVGRDLARRIRYDFVDADQLIERRFQRPLGRIMELLGMKEFMKAEEEILLTLRNRHCVLAPGGSAVYYPKAMRHLKSLGLCVYLKVPLGELKSRLGDRLEDHVVRRGGNTLRALFAERRPLYDRYADLTVDGTGPSVEKVSNTILFKLGAIPIVPPVKKAKTHRHPAARR
jgi:shikimate kinase